MIFICGMIFVTIGFLIMGMFGNRGCYSHNLADYIGGVGIYGGIAAMVYSVATVLWKVMP